MGSSSLRLPRTLPAPAWKAVSLGIPAEQTPRVLYVWMTYGFPSTSVSSLGGRAPGEREAGPGRSSARPPLRPPPPPCEPEQGQTGVPAKHQGRSPSVPSQDQSHHALTGPGSPSQKLRAAQAGGPWHPSHRLLPGSPSLPLHGGQAEGGLDGGCCRGAWRRWHRRAGPPGRTRSSFRAGVAAYWRPTGVSSAQSCPGGSRGPCMRAEKEGSRVCLWRSPWDTGAH